MGVLQKIITQQKGHNFRRTKTLMALYNGPVRTLVRYILDNSFGSHLMELKNKKGHMNKPDAESVYRKYLKKNVSRRTDLNMFVAASVWALRCNGLSYKNKYLSGAVRHIMELYTDDFLDSAQQNTWLNAYRNGYVDGLIDILKPKPVILIHRRSCCVLL